MQTRALSLKLLFNCGCVILFVLFAVPVYFILKQTFEVAGNATASRDANDLADQVFNARVSLVLEREAGLATLRADSTPSDMEMARRSERDVDEAIKGILEKKEVFASAADSFKLLSDKFEALKKERKSLIDKNSTEGRWQSAATDCLNAVVTLGRAAFIPSSGADLGRYAKTLRDDVSESVETLRRQNSLANEVLRGGKRLNSQQDDDLRQLAFALERSSSGLINLANTPATASLILLSPDLPKSLTRFKLSSERVKTQLDSIGETGRKGDAGAVVAYSVTLEAWTRDFNEAISDLKSIAQQASILGKNAQQQTAGNASFAIILNITVAVVALLFITVLVWQFHSRILGKLTTLTDVAIRIERGDEKARAPVYSSDEIGVLAATFNKMLDARQKARETSEADYRHLQEGVQNLLKLTREVSRGDLAVRMPATQGVLGQVSDAINGMLKNFSQLILDVQVLASRVATASKEIQASSENLNKGSVEQTREIERTNAAIEKMAAQGQQIAKNSEGTSIAADKTRSEAEEGSRTVVQVMDGMERVRFNVQSGAKKIKRLGERSMEISTIVNTISDISAQTDMLALNAALDAARADQADTGFSDAVRRLSERVAAATAEIGELISGMQADTNESVASMETQTTEVEQESRMVYTAGESLKRIRDSALSSASLTKQINEAAKAQVEETDDVIKAMQVVYQIAAHAQKEAEQTKNATESLSILSGYLSSHISQFRIADSTAAPNAPSAPKGPAPSAPSFPSAPGRS